MNISSSKQPARWIHFLRDGRLVQGLQVAFATSWAMLGVLYIVKGHPLGWVAAIASLLSAFLLGARDASMHRTHPVLTLISMMGLLASLVIVVDVALDLASAR